MKKLFYSTLLFFSGSVATSVSSLNGWYAGAEIGYAYQPYVTKVSQDYTGVGVVPVKDYIKRSAEKVNQGSSYGGIVGYGWINNGHYLGLEAGAHYPTAVKTRIISLAAIDGSYWPFSTAYHRGLTLAFGPRLGLVLEGPSLAYLKVEGQLSQDSLRYQSVGGYLSSPAGNMVSTTSSQLYRSPGQANFVGVLGIGFEKSIGGFFIRAEYTYNFGARMKQKVTYVQHTGGRLFTNTDTQAVRYTASMIKAGIGFRF